MYIFSFKKRPLSATPYLLLESLEMKTSKNQVMIVGWFLVFNATFNNILRPGWLNELGSWIT